jgi:hypothetical protein
MLWLASSASITSTQVQTLSNNNSEHCKNNCTKLLLAGHLQEITGACRKQPAHMMNKATTYMRSCQPGKLQSQHRELPPALSLPGCARCSKTIAATAATSSLYPPATSLLALCKAPKQGYTGLCYQQPKALHAPQAMQQHLTFLQLKAFVSQREYSTVTQRL